MSRRARGLHIAGIAAVAAALLCVHGPAAGGSVAAASPQPSSRVVVIPGFVPPRYTGYWGAPNFPAGAKELAGYQFFQLSAPNVTPTALQSYDTIVLYGVRWNDLSASAQAAINGFARTGKVLIWDSDGTGAQNYSTFIHPFAVDASGENGTAHGSVVSFPSGPNVLASPDPSSPYYLDPAQLVADKNLINDVSAMTTDTPGWAPALIAANKSIPAGGWAIAWSYGVTSDHTGLVIYSGIDADAFEKSSTPNYALKELALQLAAPFVRTADIGCAPSCAPPPVTGSRTPGQSGAGKATYAQCFFAKPLPSSWVRARVALTLHTSVAAGITAKAMSTTGQLLGLSAPKKPGQLLLFVNTRLLQSNRASKVVAVVFVKESEACKTSLSLKVDNVPARVLLLLTSRDARGHVVKLRLNEAAGVTITAVGVRRTVSVGGGKTVAVALPSTVSRAKLRILDRAGNGTTRTIAWP